MIYPSLEKVEEANHIQICKWHRFLKSPTNAEETKILKRIAQRLKDFGGITPKISKLIGWNA